MSIRECATEIEVGVKTSFYMRHRILDVSEQLCIETGIDRKGNIVMGVVCNGRITTNEIVGFFDGKLGKDVTFVVDSHKSYMGIKKDLNVELKQVPRGKSMLDSVYVNALHSGFKRWLMPF